MPTTLDRAVYTNVGTSKQEIFEVDSGKTVAINWVRVTNTTMSTVVVNLEVWPLDVSGNAVRWWKDVSLSAEQSFHFRGVRYLLATDTVHVWSDTATSLDVQCSWLEKNSADPAPTRNRTASQSVTTVTAVYTAPTTKTAAVNDLTICNNSGSSSVIDVNIDSGGTNYTLLKQHTLDTSGKDALYEYAGVINLNAQDKIEVTATNGVDVLVSAQES